MLDGNSEVNWTLFDFILAFILLTSVSFSIEWILRKIENKKIKTAVILFLALSFLLLWGELAVGIFDSPIAGD
jgi:hypothetical protein